MVEGDPLSRVLYVDLSPRRFWVEDRGDLFDQWIGGTGAAMKLLEEECPAGVDPLGPENPIILAVGPLTSLYPMASKTVALFKSPHTGNLGESHAGGRSAVSIRLAGYGAIVIRGRSETPVYLAIHGDEVGFRDASALWGMRSCGTAGRIIREREPGSGTRTIMRIGPAGERGVTYACVTLETYRHFGRLGLGAVFGSKMLKALLVSGKMAIPVGDKKAYRTLYQEIFSGAVESEAMKKYHELGTSVNVLPLSDAGGLPTRNLRQSSFEGAEAISGETLAREVLGRRVACSHCPVGCIHLAALRTPYQDEPYFYKTSMVSYDYELIYALGAMLGISERSALLNLIDAVEQFGMDIMSTGVILAWATEAVENDLIPEQERGGVAFRWGDWESYAQAVAHIVDQPTQFYAALAKGVDHAANIYGGQEYALAWGGQEMPGYHTGPAAHVGFFTGARHSHLDSAGYSVDQKTLQFESQSPEAVADVLWTEEAWRQILSSAVICFFARGIYRPELLLRALELAGMGPPSEETLMDLGARILSAKHRFKRREGFVHEGIRFPERIGETPGLSGLQVSETFVRKAASHYFKRLGG